MTITGKVVICAFLSLIAFTALPAVASADGYPDRHRGPDGHYDKPYAPHGSYGRSYTRPGHPGARGGWGGDFGGSVYFPGGSVRWSPGGGSVSVWGVNVRW